MSFTWKDNGQIFKGEGIYHLTFAVVNRAPILGKLEPLSKTDAEGHTAWVRATELGRAVLTKMNELIVRHPELQIIWKELMPDHLHVLIWMHEGFEGSIKMVARGYAQGCSKIARRLAHPAQPTAGAGVAAAGLAAGAGVAAGAGSGVAAGLSIYAAQSDCADHTPSPSPQASASEKQEQSAYDCGNGAPTLFSPPFIRTLARRGQLDRMVKYVKSNPDNAWMRRMHPDLYTIRRSRSIAGLLFDTMGKERLLDYPDTQVIALPRALTPEQIAHEVQLALSNAQQGCITYTAAINAGEKAVAKAIREAGFPMVVMMLKGFPPEGSEAARYFHPGMVYHQACGEGRLFLLAPHPDNYLAPELIVRTEATLRLKAEAKGHHYQPIPHTSTRWRMIAGNEMLKMIAGE